YRPTSWAQLEIDGQRIPLPSAVIEHFRQATAASGIKAAVPVEVYSDAFVHRDAYLRGVVDRIGVRPLRPGIVFLDPDTGLASRTPSLEHVLDRELAEVWGALGSGDLLVFYQHQTNRNGQPWVAPKKEQFEQAIGLPIGTAKLARSEAIARDVVFFYAQKTG
ncbi:MAG: hypothetical protein ABL993_08120, partial [Vicinamibacterales bacterium]